MSAPVNCDLTNPNPSGPATPFAPFTCGPLSNPSFGLNDPTVTQYSHDSQFGWGKRSFDWEFSAGVQREIAPRVSVDVSYFRRWYGNWVVTDNTALSASQYTTFTVSNVPGLPPELQGATGTAVEGNSNVQSNLVTRSLDYGNMTERWNGVDFSVNARLRNGVFLFGGISTGRTIVDNCAVVAQVPEALTVTINNSAIAFSPSNCHFEQPFLTQYKANGSYNVPKADVQLSVAFMSLPGPAVRAETTVTERAPGQPLQGANASLLVPLIPEYFTLPSAVAGGPSVISKEYGDRLNQLDVRVGKVVRLGVTRTTFTFDVYNLCNGNAAQFENNRAQSFRSPTSVQLARFIKLGAQFDF